MLAIPKALGPFNPYIRSFHTQANFDGLGIDVELFVICTDNTPSNIRKLIRLSLKTALKYPDLVELAADEYASCCEEEQDIKLTISTFTESEYKQWQDS